MIRCYRVHYSLITMDTYQDFTTEQEAVAFANKRRNDISRYQTCHAWRQVRIEEVR